MSLMLFRSHVCPKNALELLPFLFLVFIIPVIYWLEIWVVLPNLYSLEKSFWSYIIHFILGHYFLFNVVGNLLGVILTDTSIRGRMMPSQDSPAAAAYCDVCNVVTPARSYHCPSCKICILRRDHHCLFTACCIGHYNYRYFLMFLLHMFLSVLVCIPYNTTFLWDHLSATNFLAVCKVFFPVIIFVFGADFTVYQGYLILWVVSLVGMLFIGLWFYFHLRLAMSGRLVHELRRQTNLYDLGLKNNLEETLGRRWHLVWISPFLQSDHVCDGITFRTKAHTS